MTVYCHAPEWLKTALMLLSLLAILGEFLLVSIRLSRGGLKRALYCVPEIVLGILLLSLFSCSRYYYVDIVNRIPLFLLIIIIIAIILHGHCFFIWEKRRSAGELSVSAIREGADDLPSGVCFSDEDGRLILCNRVMQQLAHRLMGRSLQSEQQFFDALQTAPPDKAERLPAGDTWRFSDGSVWRFSRAQIRSGTGTAYSQVIASNVTELHQKNQELERSNQELTVMNERMNQLIRNITAIAREEEVLALKMRVHDDIGRSVIATRQLLVQDRPLSEAKQIVELWQSAVNLLQHSTPPAGEESPLQQLKKSATGIGVEISLDGCLPENRHAAYLLIAAMRECVTNTARHAGGSEIYVTLSEQPGSCTALITNNGRAPDGPVTEGGGLTSLRKRIEQAGGTMRIRCTPRFCLIITIPTEKEEDLWSTY